MKDGQQPLLRLRLLRIRTERGVAGGSEGSGGEIQVQRRGGDAKLEEVKLRAGMGNLLRLQRDPCDDALFVALYGAGNHLF